MVQETADALAFYPIRTLSALTGVNARTIRAWERRYELLTPFRTDSGHRLYTDEHVNTIKEVVRLLEQGVPISRVKPLLNQPEALKIHGDETRLASQESEWKTFKDELIDATQKQALPAIEKTCRQVLERYPFDVVLRYLLVPTRNELKTRYPASTCSLFDFILTEKLLHRLVTHFPAEAQAKVLVCSDRERDMSVEYLSYCWALAGQKLMPVPFSLSLEAFFSSNHHADAILFYFHCVEFKASIWPRIKQFAENASVPLFAAGIFDQETLAFLRNLGVVPLSDDARKSAILMSDILQADPTFAHPTA